LTPRCRGAFQFSNRLENLTFKHSNETRRDAARCREPNGRSIRYLAPCGVSVFDLRDDDFEHISDLLRPMRRASAAMIDLYIRRESEALRHQRLAQAVAGAGCILPGITAIALIPGKAPVVAVSISAKRDTNAGTVEPAVQARQGVTGHNVRYVLAFGTCGVIAAFVIIYFLFFR